MNQAVTKVNVLGPVIINVVKVDVPHYIGRQHYRSRQWQEIDSFTGVLGDGMVQDGVFVNLGDLHSSVTKRERQYAGTSLRGQGLANDYAEVGLGGSTRSGIKARTWGSAQQLDASFNVSSAVPPRSVI